MKKYVVMTYNNGQYEFIKPDLLTTSIYSDSVIWIANNEQEINEKIIANAYDKKYRYQINELVNEGE